MLEYSPTKEAFIRAIGAHNVATLEELKELHLYDFGIFIELLPDDEEKQMLENNIQIAISQKLIDLDDAIDLREIRNIKLANRLLKVKRRKKLERDQIMQQQNIQAQSQANQQAQQAAAQSEIDKNRAKTESEENLEKTKNALKIQYLQQESRVKKELMMLEFKLNNQMKMDELNSKSSTETMREDRKDSRESKNRKHQMDIARQKSGGNSLNNFESSGNDIVTGDAGLGGFGL